MHQAFGIQFSSEGLADLAGRIVSEPVPEGTGPRLLVTANVDHIVQLRRSPEFRGAYAAAWTATVDGFPVYAYSLMRGAKAPARVTGADLFAVVMTKLDPAAHRVFFIANSEKTGAGLRAWLLSRGFSESSIDVCVPPFGFERDTDYSCGLAGRIRQHQATHLFMGVGAPKSEIWCHRNRPLLGDCYILCVGAGLEFFLGLKKRAPSLIQKIGMEWLWRCGQEPRRLLRRYFLESWPFLMAMSDDLRGRTESLSGKSVTVISKGTRVEA